MNTTQSPLTRFLIPIDTEENNSLSITLMKCIATTLGQRIEKITLFHVMAGKYLSQHMANIDIRVEHIISSDKFQSLKKDYIEEQIKPSLEAARNELEQSGISAPIDIVIEDGDPVKHIVAKTNQDSYSTLILQRNKMSQVDKLFVGSVTSGVLHHAVNGTIYLPGMKITEADCTPQSCLVAMDESNSAQAALKKAAILLAAAKDNLEKIVLVHVLDIAQCGEALSGGQVPKNATYDVIENAAEYLVAQGIDADRIVKIACCGNPDDVLLEEVDRHNVNFIVMGRRDRTALKELFMGSVSRKIVQRCQAQTVVMVSA